MKLTRVNCENCGAPLKVREGARFVTCAHCDTQLRIERTEDTVSTVVLEAKVEKIASEVGELRNEAKLARLDREWEEERDSLMIAAKNGARVVPKETNGTLSIYAGVVCGLGMAGAGLWTTSLSDQATGMIPAIMVIAGALVAAIGVSVGNGVVRKARAYAAAEEKYQKRRARLLRH